MRLKYSLVLVAAMIFVAGLLVGEELSSKTAMDGQIVGLNHVALRVPDFEEASDFYENTLGFPLTYKFDDDNGDLLFAYFQISKSTFIELLPADDEHPAGLDHFGLETGQMDSVVAHFRDKGIEVTDPLVSPYTRVNLSHALDSDGIYFELIEAVDGSELQKVMNDWER